MMDIWLILFLRLMQTGGTRKPQHIENLMCGISLRLLGWGVKSIHVGLTQRIIEQWKNCPIERWG